MFRAALEAIIQMIQRAFIAVLTGYQYMVSPWLAPHCRFYPTCSQYAKEALSEYGLLHGIFMTARRLLSCHPFHPGGYAPVIEKQNRHQ